MSKEYSTTIPNLTLSNGIKMPALGLGTYDSTNEKEMNTAIKAAIDAGYRHFDCAYYYNNEDLIGKAIHEAIAESDGKLKREDFFITSKCWNNYHSKENVPVCLNKVLNRFKFDYIDLFLMHWPMGFQENGVDEPVDENGKMIYTDIHYTDTYKAMEELVESGKAKSIGLSNFNIDQTKDILNMCKIRPVCVQVEVSAHFRNEELAEFCQKENIILVAYAPLRSTPYAVMQAGVNPDDIPPQNLMNPFENPSILEIAKKHKKSAAQVILRWLVQRNIVPIPKSVTPSRILQNAQIFDFELNAEEMLVFSNLKRGSRLLHYENARDHPFYPFKND